MKKEYTISINAPLEKSFDAVSAQNIPKWMGGEMQTQILGGPNTGSPVGIKFKHTVQRVVTLEGEVIACERPTVLGVSQRYKGLNGTVFYNFKQVGENTTELTCVVEIPEEKTWQTVLITTLKPLIDQMVGMQLHGIKNIAEETKT